MTLPNCLAGTVLVERLELKWLILVFRCVTVVLGIPDGSVEDILPCQMALFCVKCVLQDTGVAAVVTQPSSAFAIAMDFTFINCHLSSRITIDVPSATALALGLDCQQLQLQQNCQQQLPRRKQQNLLHVSPSTDPFFLMFFLFVSSHQRGRLVFNNLVPEYLGLKLAQIQVAYIVTECGELCNFSGRTYQKEVGLRSH